MIKLGVVLILLSVVFLVGTLAAPDVLAPLAPLYCHPGEKLTSGSSTYSRPGETVTSIYFYCTDSDGVQKSDVSSQITLITMAGFFVLLAGGIALTTIGASRSTRTARQISTPGFSSSSYNLGNRTAASWGSAARSDPDANNAVVNDLMDGLQHGVIRFGGQEIHVNDLKSGNYQFDTAQASKRTLADTLRQLEDAHTQGLINDDEYQKLRQEALDKLV